ncbi:MAG: hypothetical protein HQK76_07075 [Desulfobacterales bacterium]|nr:hypothetical protein [Desulfobacterales bacterium]
MICPKCNFKQSDDNVECLQCGIIFSKYCNFDEIGFKTSVFFPEQVNMEEKKIKYLDKLLFDVETETSIVFLLGRIFLFCVIFFWGLKFIISPMASNFAANSFLHIINKVIHEAGHLVFSPFGQFMMGIGGTLAQLVVPIFILLIFLITNRDPLSASFCLWWFSENIMELAPYINDAKLQTFLQSDKSFLIGKGIHDWAFILEELDLMNYAHLIANLVHTTGVALMLTSFIWIFKLLYKQITQFMKS